ncbi:hypothetical protein BH23ACT9_BH23ACT9_21650 [soil metagenome]
MGYVTNDPKKSDEQQPGGSGLVINLGLMACPQCRREVPGWLDECAECEVQAVPRTSLGTVMPAIPAHLLADDQDEDPGTDDPR